jgi:hypothetical protein
MSIRIETCSYCNGRKVAERVEEKVGGEWRPLPSHCLAGMPHYAVAEMIENHAKGNERGEFLRWADCACPRCDGRGEYEVEHMVCKIF